jgi:hypothetical protein
MPSRIDIELRYREYSSILERNPVASISGEETSKLTKESVQSEDMNIHVQDMSINGSNQLLVEGGENSAGMRYLSPTDYVWIASPLTRLLQYQISKDHIEYWWITHDFLYAFNDRVGVVPSELVKNLELLIRLVINAEDMMWNLSKNTNEILRHSEILATYLGYPTLEGLVKCKCSDYIDMDGNIRKGRKIRELGPRGQTNYKYHDDGHGICSSLGMLLWHLETEVLSPEYQAIMKNLREETGKMFEAPRDRVLGRMTTFRNNALHGRNQARREYGVLINWICFVVWTILCPSTR